MSEHIHYVTDDSFAAEVLQAQEPVLLGRVTIVGRFGRILGTQGQGCLLSVYLSNVRAV